MKRRWAYGVRACSLMVVAVLLSGCTLNDEKQLFDGNYYPGKARGEKADRREFTASVRRASRGIEGAQKAVLHEATRYCLINFGTSEIAWRGNGAPSDAPVYRRSGDTVSVGGQCVIWQ